MPNPKVIVITGNGFNCEKETKHAFDMVGGSSDIVHMNNIVDGDVKFADYQIMAFIGGFSYGDHLGGGKVASNIFRYKLAEQLNKFVNSDKLVIGICNGFQVITQLGILPGFDNNYTDHIITLTSNNSNRYENRWVHLKANSNSNCIFTNGIDKMFLPSRHGEGKLFSPDNSVFEKLAQNNQIALQYIDPDTNIPTESYPQNPNGSFNGIAAICDPSGKIFGMMPHPEAFLSPYNHPYWTRQKAEGILPDEGEGVKIFKNAVEYFN